MSDSLGAVLSATTPGWFWAVRRRIAIRLRMLSNWIDQGDGLWIDDFFAKQQTEKYEDLRKRYNSLRMRIEEFDEVLNDFPAEADPDADSSGPR